MTASYAEFSPALPRALEGLSPRERILWSMARVVAEEGFESVTVTGVVERAGVSRETFNELFEDKKECVLAAHARVIDGLVAHVSRAFEGHGPWPQKIRRGLAACLEAFSAEPKVARMATVEVPATRPEARRCYRGALERFRPFFREGRDYAEADTLPPDTELMAVGGAEAIIFDEIVSGRTEELPNLLPDILFTVLVPYIGPEAAKAEGQQASLSASRRFRPSRSST
ncbi:MAG: TetR/AcrR family transcriptional regulator [Solirubrobacterales bacterium]